jgi:flagellum-specific ATP synthase
VGKSTLLGMLARHVRADVAVIALIGERGREVGDFLERTLGSALANSVVVVATADEPALRRVLAAHTASALAESFADSGRDVLLIMDSVTRYAMAQREIGLAAGEPATARGYTPSVFSRLPALFERAGAFRGKGTISGLYTVLVEGDDLQEPVADAVRSIVDGHIVLSRELANHGQYPAVDLLNSRSRLAPALMSEAERALVDQALRVLSTHERNRDMVELGTYRPGANPELDGAIRLVPKLQAFLGQKVDEFQPRAAAFQRLKELMR